MQIQKPLEKNWTITQRFETKVNYMRSGIHSGIDWACPNDTDLLACFDGIIVKTENILINSGYGRAIYLQSDENNKVVALYGHCSQLLAKVGNHVKAGTIIAKSGKSGFVLGKNGYHLHFALMVGGIWTDPMPYFDGKTSLKKNNPIKIPVKNGDEQLNTYTIKKGDTLYGIAKKLFGDANKWRFIFDCNTDIIENPKHIRPGQVIKIPKV